MQIKRDRRIVSYLHDEPMQVLIDDTDDTKDNQ
jgi:hypothetical protein